MDKKWPMTNCFSSIAKFEFIAIYMKIFEEHKLGSPPKLTNHDQFYYHDLYLIMCLLKPEDLTFVDNKLLTTAKIMYLKILYAYIHYTASDHETDNCQRKCITYIVNVLYDLNDA